MFPDFFAQFSAWNLRTPYPIPGPVPIPFPFEPDDVTPATPEHAISDRPYLPRSVRYLTAKSEFRDYRFGV